MAQENPTNTDYSVYSILQLVEICDSLKPTAETLRTDVKIRRVELRDFEKKLEQVTNEIRRITLVLDAKTKEAKKQPLLKRAEDSFTPQAVEPREAVRNVLGVVNDNVSGPFRGQFSVDPVGANFAQIARIMLLQATELGTSFGVAPEDGRKSSLTTSSDLGPSLGRVHFNVFSDIPLTGWGPITWDNLSKLRLVAPLVGRIYDYISYSVDNIAGQEYHLVSVVRNFSNGHGSWRQKEVSTETALQKIQTIREALQTQVDSQS